MIITPKDVLKDLTEIAEVKHTDVVKSRFMVVDNKELLFMLLDDKDVPELLDKTESSIFAISKGSTTKGFIALKDTLAESFDRIDELHNKGAGLRGVETGFTDLDNLLSGMQKSNLLILAARPGQGKTAMMINIDILIYFWQHKKFWKGLCRQ